MSKLSPTLRMRLKAHEARKKHLADQDLVSQEQSHTISNLKQLATLSLKQDFGKDGLNICSVSTFNTQESLLVNIKTFNQTNIKSLNVSFLDLHAVCLLETKTILEAGENLTDRYSPHTVINEEYCALLGQQDGCQVEQEYY